MRTLPFPALLLGLLFLSGVGPPPLYAQSSAEPVTALGPDDEISVFGTYTEQFVATDDVLYFPVDKDGTGDELYTYDGSAVTRVSDLPDFTSPRWPTVYDDNLYFTVNGSEGNELYEYDGSSVQRITNINSSGGSSIAESVVYDGRLFFGADPDGGFSDGDLYAYDGSTITRVTNTGGDLDPSNFIVYDDGGGKTLYFNGTSSSAGTEIFEYDGSSVSLAVDVNDGADSSEPTTFAVYDGDLYFQAGTGSDGFQNRELYQTDGNSAQIVDDINDSGPSRPSDLTVYDDGNGAALYFTATDDGDDTELHRWNGSDVAEIDVDGDPTNGSSPDGLVSAGGLLYFSATVNGEENLYQYDGGSDTVSQVADVNSSGGSNPYGTVVFNNVLYFAADDGDNFELYRTTFQVPVELASLDGAPIDGSAVQLEWRTASEQNNAGFRVERSRGSGPWQEVGFVDSKSESGTTSEPQTYRFTDEDLPYGADTLEYRLQQIDLDGSESLSDRVTIQRTVDEVELLGTFPNPARTQTTVQFAVPGQQKVALKLYDVMGREVRTLARGPQEGRTEMQVELSGLSSGIYVLRLQAGGTTKTQKMTVVR